MFDNGGATFHPIPGVNVIQPVDFADAGAVNMPADDAIIAFTPRLISQNTLIFADKADRLLDLLLGPVGQRPILPTQKPPGPIKPRIQPKGELISSVAKMREPFGIDHDSIKLITMRRRLHHLDPTEMHTKIAAQNLVMNAGNILGFRAIMGAGQ
jgi:hypothetical protein